MCVGRTKTIHKSITLRARSARYHLSNEFYNTHIKEGGNVIETAVIKNIKFLKFAGKIADISSDKG